MNRAALTAATTVAPTTTTTAPVATPAAIRPPTAILSAASGQVAGVLGSWCWPQLNGETLCLSLSRSGPPDPPASLPVTQGETVTLRFETAVPLVDLQVGLWTGGPPRPAIAAPVANPSRFPIRLAPGRHVIGVVAYFQGTPPIRVEYDFEVVVRTTARPIALTG